MQSDYGHTAGRKFENTVQLPIAHTCPRSTQQHNLRRTRVGYFDPDEILIKRTLVDDQAIRARISRSKKSRWRLTLR